MLRYEYDAWGRCKIVKQNGEEAEYNAADPSSWVAFHNHFRYRGYFYDSVNGLYYLQTRFYDPELCRFISPDSIDYVDPTIIGGVNLYSYCNNNPVMFIDPDGHFWDYVFDAIFIIWGVYDVIKNPKDWLNWVALGIDIIFAVLPFVTSGEGQIIKLGSKVDDAFEIANRVKRFGHLDDVGKVTIIGRDMERVIKVGKITRTVDNLFDGKQMWKLYHKLKASNSKWKNIVLLTNDIVWTFGKLRKGYTILDIGITAEQATLKLTERYGRYYGTEKIITTIWELRNIWKFFVNYDY